MSARKPKAHLFLEGGGIVTRTHDKVTAQRLIVDEYLDSVGGYDDGEEMLSAYRLFSLRGADLETGRMVPEAPEAREFSGYSWWWRSGYKPGKPGVTRAVVWHS